MKLLWPYCFLFFICSCQWQEGQVRVNEKSTVIYQGGDITKREAKRLGAVLADLGYFNTHDTRTVYLRKEHNQYLVTFRLNREDFLTDKENSLAGLSVWQQWLQEQAFGYAPTQLIVTDEGGKVLHKIDATAKPATPGNP